MLHDQTPLNWSPRLSRILQCDVLLKWEALQPTGSFKIRGIGTACQRAKAKGAKTFLSTSGGNAGYAVAYAAYHLDVAAKVIVPKTTPAAMRKRIRELGALVEVHGDSWDECNEMALNIIKDKPDIAYIPPFDHADIWDGHSTLIAELTEQPEAIVVSVGGGGLLKGVLQGLEDKGWQGTKVISVETKGADSFAQSMTKGHLVTLPAITSLAHSLGAKQVGQDIFQHAKKFGVQPIVIPDEKAVQACTKFFADHLHLVEPACGAALSLAYDKNSSLQTFKNIVIIVCGGIGVSLSQIFSHTNEFGE